MFPKYLHPFFFSILALVIAPAMGQEVGEPAPALVVHTVIQGPDATLFEWPRLEGNAVVLEFWATWCGPCVAAIPHWNELVKEFEGRPIRFISLTDDVEERVRLFLKQRQLAGWVATDKGHSTFEGFSVNGIPVTVLVDAGGVVQAVTQPSRVTVDMLEDLLARRSIAVPPMPDVEAELSRRLGNAGDSEPFFRATVRPAVEGAAVMSAGKDFLHAFSYPVLTVMTIAYDTPRTRIRGEQGMPPEGVFDFIFSTPGRPTRLRPTMRHAIEAAFGFDTQWQEKDMDVLVLRRDESQELKLPRAVGDHGGSRISAGKVEGFGLSSGELALLLEKSLARPVVDETALEGRFDAVLSWQAELPATAAGAVREQWGLELSVERRSVRFLRLIPR